MESLLLGGVLTVARTDRGLGRIEINQVFRDESELFGVERFRRNTLP